MQINLGQLLVWVIIGLLAGSLAGWLFAGRRRGFGVLVNLVIGLLGALLGGALFQALGIRLNLGQITLSFDDFVAAFIGAVLLLLLIAFLPRR